MSTESIKCPDCGAPAPKGIRPGKPVTCEFCDQKYKLTTDDDGNSVTVLVVDQSSDSAVIINAANVRANRIVGHDLIETHYHEGASTPPEAEAELLAALVSQLGLRCPHCGKPVDGDAKPGKRWICGECGKKAFITTDGKIMTWIAAVQQGLNLPAAKKAAPGGQDLGGDGEGVNIEAGDGDVDVPGDVTGRFKIGDD